MERSSHMKKCSKCKQDKCPDQFYKNKLSKDGLGSQCKVCSNSASVAWYKANTEIERLKKRSWRQNNPDKVKNQNRRDSLKIYGLSIKDWEILFENQNGVCAICDMPETLIDKGILRRLAVDHCHETGKVRSLLCSKCNQAIGLLNDNSKLLDKAASYLRKHKA